MGIGDYNFGSLILFPIDHLHRKFELNDISKYGQII